CASGGFQDENGYYFPDYFDFW
nr:immunoglobulin heavy chain junction region [Macaca mulatta]MOX58967.1 immunoglobulin heavy chain junction region [Macaca mulatta]MOX61085.1 immunoglobulin heavy chain junction region [Macaca mulatta]MOX61539.1 immunoglobulin heavy chain junction region [Macaca mulatta]MOX62835.1 immunoglobulin heavy chain junction region [Macaca mulatta]